MPADTLLERPLPHNLDAERCVLGAIILDNHALDRAIEKSLKPEDFFLDQNRRIFDRMIALSEANHAIDDITLIDDLGKRGELESVGGVAYVTSLTTGMPRVSNVEHYARIVKEKSLLRSLAHATNAIQQRAIAGDEDADALLDEAESQLFDLAESRVRAGFVGVKELVQENYARLEQIFTEGRSITGLATGYTRLDERTSGFQPSELIILAARPSMGKTALALNLAQNIAVQHREPVAVFSLEMSKESLLMRLLASQAKVDSHKFRTGHLGREDWRSITEALAELGEAPLWIDDSGSATVIEMGAKCRRLAKDKGLKLVIVDYLQLVHARGKFGSRNEEVASISRGLKALAKELKVPVLCLSQLTRAPEREDRKPQLSDLRECVTGDTLVCLGNGQRVPIAELVGATPEVWAVSPDGKITLSKSEKVWLVGKRPVFRLALASGRELRATAEHRVLTGSGWRRIADIGADDRVALSRAIPQPAKCTSWPEPWIILLAHLMGDGGFIKHQPLRYTTSSEENSRVVSEAAASAFGVQVTRHAGRGNWHQLVFSGNGNRWRPAGLNRWLRDLGIFGQRSAEKRLPAPVFSLPNSQIGLLLQHLWATDGSIHTRAEGGASRVFFSTCSRLLAFDVAALLMRLGMVGRLRKSAQGSHNALWTVDVSGKEQQERFLEMVGAFGPRAAASVKLRELLSTTKSNPNVDTLPKEIFDRVRALMLVRGISQRQMAALRGTSYGGTSHFRFSPSREALASYAAILADAELNRYARSDLFWDRVLSIEPDGEEDVYDMTVPGPANWLADGLVSHNSGAIEQDADVVMFIHRPNAFDAELPDEERNKTEVIIAKQRNGPVGKINFAFMHAFTRFEQGPDSWDSGGM